MNLAKSYNNQLKQIYRIKSWDCVAIRENYATELVKTGAVESCLDMGAMYDAIFYLSENITNIDFEMDLLMKTRASESFLDKLYFLKGCISYNNKIIRFSLGVNKKGIAETGRYTLGK